jgi:hypothetical protein
MTRLIALTALLAAGCVGTPSSSDQDGGFAVASGIYDIQVGPATGDCSPPTLSGPLPRPMLLYVGELGHGLLLPTPTDSSQSAVSRIEIFGGRWDESVNSCGARHETELVIDLQSGSRLDVTRTDVWSAVAGATRSLPGCGLLPSRDCRSTVQLTYTLADFCPASNCFARDGESFLTNVCVCAGSDLGAPGAS